MATYTVRYNNLIHVNSVPIRIVQGCVTLSHRVNCTTAISLVRFPVSRGAENCDQLNDVRLQYQLDLVT